MAVEDARRRVDEELSKRKQRVAADDEWRFLVRHHFVADDYLPSEEIAVAVNVLVDIRELRGAGRAPRSERRPAARIVAEAPRVTDYESAVSKLLSEDANRLDVVTNYRERHLSGELLDRGYVFYWVQDEIERADLPVLAAFRPMDPERLERTDNHRMSLLVNGPITDHGPRLVYEFDGPSLPPSLVELYDVVVQLVRRYGWSHSDAVDLVAAGTIPRFNTVQVAFVPPEGDAPLVTSRLILSIDPTTNPDEVADRYRGVRRRVTTAQRHNPAPKSYRLAQIDRRRAKETWLDVMQRWNKVNPDDKYEDTDRFQRDVSAAVRRVLCPPILDHLPTSQAASGPKEVS